MGKPNNYTLSSTPKIFITTTDVETGENIIPVLARLSIRTPEGTVFTVSGGDMSAGDTYLAYTYTPTTSGFYAYEAWCEDASGGEAAGQNGFYVTDRVDN